jgi:hypothetical protein
VDGEPADVVVKQLDLAHVGAYRSGLTCK